MKKGNSIYFSGSINHQNGWKIYANIDMTIYHLMIITHNNLHYLLILFLPSVHIMQRHIKLIFYSINDWMICVSNKLGHQWFRIWLVTYSVPNHHLNQCCFIANWMIDNKFQWNLDQSKTIFIKENELESAKWWLFRLSLNVLMQKRCMFLCLVFELPL